MRAISRIIRWACLLAGICGLAISSWAFIDPSAFPQMRMDGMVPSPRWRAALGFVFSLLLVGYGTGKLRHRTLP